jgi:hypothetical protein
MCALQEHCCVCAPEAEHSQQSGHSRNLKSHGDGDGDGDGDCDGDKQQADSSRKKEV